MTERKVELGKSIIKAIY